MRQVKYPSTQIARERFGASSPAYKRIKALEKWAVSHGYDGYKAIQRRTRRDKEQQTAMNFEQRNDNAEKRAPDNRRLCPLKAEA